MEKPGEINGASGRKPPYLKLIQSRSEPASDAPERPATPDETVTRALGAGFGLALRDAEAALYVARQFSRGAASARAARRALETAREAFAEMERALS